MGRLLSQKSARKLMEQNGWAVETGGKHVVKMTKDGCRPVTLPYHGGEEYSKDLSNRIRKQAGLK
jgi:predicted RNA binding protein YcfA (HicA-like mRNA interferase family)